MSNVLHYITATHTRYVYCVSEGLCTCISHCCSNGLSVPTSDNARPSTETVSSVLVGSSAIVPEWKKKIDQEMAQPVSGGIDFLLTCKFMLTSFCVTMSITTNVMIYSYVVSLYVWSCMSAIISDQFCTCVYSDAVWIKGS